MDVGISALTQEPVVDLLVAYGDQVGAVLLAHTARIGPIPAMLKAPQFHNTFQYQSP